MAKMNHHDRVLYYYKRLLHASNKKAEAESIAQEINTLYWTSNNRPLTKDEKLHLISEIARLYHKGTLITESTKPSNERFNDSFSGRPHSTASDNSGVLDLIAAMKGEIK
ncbi:MAG: hypothetical protein ACRC9E_15385 [Plesiomonas shigelloides]